jgi:hypothetical protein
MHAHGAAQQGLGSVPHLEHDELTGPGPPGDGGALERQKEMIGVDLLVTHDAGGTIERHAEVALYHKGSGATMRRGRRPFACYDPAAMMPLKLVAHGALAGLYGGIVMALLVALLNPGGEALERLPALVAVAAVFTLSSAFLWPALYGVIRFFASGRLRISWFKARYLTAFHVVNMTVVLSSAWTTLSRSRGAVSPASHEHFALSCWLLSLAWLAAAIVILVPRLSRTHGVATGALVLSLVALAVTAFDRPGIEAPRTTSARAGPGPARPARHLLLLNFDGADLDTILTLEAEGKLPSFSRLKEEGTYGRLRSIRPCSAPVTRTTLGTGKQPHRHGVRSPLSRQLFGEGLRIDLAPVGIGFDVLLSGVMRTSRHTIADRGALTLWDITSRMGGVGRAAGWSRDLDGPPVRPDVQAGRAAGTGGLREVLDPDAARAGDPDARPRIDAILRSLQADAELLEIFERMSDSCPPGVTAISFPGLDAIAHLFLRFSRPEDFGNVAPHEVELYGGVLERYYRRMDDIVGRAASICGEQDVLFVTSSHGIDVVGLVHRLLTLGFGEKLPSGTHEHGPSGFLFARGPHLKAGESFGRGELIDVTPTALYALDLPVASDMDGRILIDAFMRRYSSRHPVTVIGTYEPSGQGPAPRRGP